VAVPQSRNIARVARCARLTSSCRSSRIASGNQLKLDLSLTCTLRSKLTVVRLSRSHRLRSWIAIVLLVAGWGVPLSRPHVANDDLLCLDGRFSADAPAQLEAASDTPKPADHCVICHAARTFRSSVVEGEPVAITQQAGAVLPVSSEAPHAPSSLGRLPARAPPLA
jgi:hypothetical protein